MITLSAIWPHVISVTAGNASSIEAKVWVAPSSIAFSRLNSTGSTAMTRLAPAMAAPCTALMPMPPMPTTTTVSPGRTSARLVAEPQPVATPQDTRATASSGRSVSTLMTEASATQEYSANVPSLAISFTGWSPLTKWRWVPSVIIPPCIAPEPASHRFWRPVLQ